MRSRTDTGGLTELFGSGDSVLSVARADVGRTRERRRQRRLGRVAVGLALIAAWLWYRALSGQSLNPFDGFSLGPDVIIWGPGVLIVLSVMLSVFLPQLTQGRAPHRVFRPEQIDIGMADVKGLGPVRDEVVRSLNLFLNHTTFTNEMGGTPRRGILFEGRPGTGKTHMAKAMAREAGVPFLFVPATSFQSHWYGMTARRIRAYFKALRKVARAEGGVIGFIEEIDAIATARGGMDHATPSAVHASGPAARFGPRVERVTVEGSGGIVNELLVQMQSFDEPTGSERLAGRAIDWVNGFLPAGHQLRRPKPAPAPNILLIAATNRADSLDPALTRPGRFDRTLTFDLPSRAGRRELVDYYLDRKAHAGALDEPVKRDELARITFGYSPVMIEHLLDEALIWALREGRSALGWTDILSAKLSEEIGLGQPVAYSERERELIATHEAGHAVVAHLSGVERRLEVLSIVKRKDSLGLLAHNDPDEHWTRTRTELEAFMRISCGGMAAEELFFGESTTGPGGDLAAATAIAAEMVGSLGMAGSLISFGGMQEGFADRNLVARVLGDAEAKAMVERLLREAKAGASAILSANRHLVEALRDALLTSDELIGEQIEAVLAWATEARGRS
jgi:ATP-dependent Zn protease